MARLWAQLYTPIFVLVALGGLVLGNAGTPNAAGEAGGNLGGLTLHLSWSRHLLDLAALGALVYAGFLAPRRVAAVIALGTGGLFTALAIAGLAVGDDMGATKGFLGFHFPVADTIFDLAFGVLGLLCGAGSLDEEATAAGR